MDNYSQTASGRGPVIFQLGCVCYCFCVQVQFFLSFRPYIIKYMRMCVLFFLVLLTITLCGIDACLDMASKWFVIVTLTKKEAVIVRSLDYLPSSKSYYKSFIKLINTSWLNYKVVSHCRARLRGYNNRGY